MRCSQCGYHSFDGLENCKKCGTILSSKGSPVVDALCDLDAPAQPFLALAPLNLPAKQMVQNSETFTPRKEKVFPSFLQSRDHDGNFITGVDEDIISFVPMSEESSDDDVPHYVVRRILATIVDLVVVAAIWCSFVAVGAWGLDQPLLDFLHFLRENMSLRITYYLILIASLLSYFTLLHCAGQTMGKMMVKLTVVNEKGDVPSFAECFFRTVGGLLSLLCGGWGYFRVLFDVEQRGWNDRISGTRVVANVDALADKADPMACESKCDEVNG